MDIVNWRQVTQERDGWRRETEEAIILFDIGATLEEEEEEEEEEEGGGGGGGR